MLDWTSRLGKMERRGGASSRYLSCPRRVSNEDLQVMRDKADAKIVSKIAPLTPSQTKALKIIRNHGPIRPRVFAKSMWPDSDGW